MNDIRLIVDKLCADYLEHLFMLVCVRVRVWSTCLWVCVRVRGTCLRKSVCVRVCACVGHLFEEECVRYKVVILLVVLFFHRPFHFWFIFIQYTS